MKYIDLHCDSLMLAYKRGYPSMSSRAELCVDPWKLEHGAAMAQFFAIFMIPQNAKMRSREDFPKTDMEYIRLLQGIYIRTVYENNRFLATAASGADMKRNARNRRISAFLSLEDGRALDNRLENVDELYGLGIRAIGLTWNKANCLGAPNSDDPAEMRRGLTPFGKEVVYYLNDKGVAVDVSHLSDGGFWDVAELTRKPFMASHSNCRALVRHPRNLTDGMIRAIARSGGVVGATFYPRFLNEDASDHHSRLASYIEHIKHLIRVGGEECPAIGSDFDGMEVECDIPTAEKMPALAVALAAAGMSSRVIEKIMYKNARRFIADTIY